MCPRSLESTVASSKASLWATSLVRHLRSVGCNQRVSPEQCGSVRWGANQRVSPEQCICVRWGAIERVSPEQCGSERGRTSTHMQLDDLKHCIPIANRHKRAWAHVASIPSEAPRQDLRETAPAPAWRACRANPRSTVMRKVAVKSLAVECSSEVIHNPR